MVDFKSEQSKLLGVFKELPHIGPLRDTTSFEQYDKLLYSVD